MEAFHISLLDEVMVSGAIAEYSATHDSLTGLTDKNAFLDRVEEKINATERFGSTSFGVIFIDLDHFKEVNDLLGHNVGDEVLIGFAKQLVRAKTRKEDENGDVVSRFGGDEFVVLVDLRPKDNPDQEQSETDKEIVITTIIDRLENELGGFTEAVRDVLKNNLDVSIGGAVWRTGDTTETLLARADRMMYIKKLQSKGEDPGYLLGLS